MNKDHYENLKAEIDQQMQNRFKTANEFYVLVNKKDGALAKVEYLKYNAVVVGLSLNDVTIFLGSLDDKDNWNIVCFKGNAKDKLTDLCKEFALTRGKNRLILCRS